MVGIFRKNVALPHSTPCRPTKRDLDQKRETPQQKTRLRGTIHAVACYYPTPRDDLLSMNSLGLLNYLHSRRVIKLTSISWAQNKIWIELADSLFSLWLIKQCQRDFQRGNRDVLNDDNPNSTLMKLPIRHSEGALNGLFIPNQNSTSQYNYRCRKTPIKRA